MPTEKSIPKQRLKLAREVSVMAWIENHFGEVLLLKQKRGNKQWTLPGGKIERGESLLDCLSREVFEETKLKVHSPILIGIFDRPDKDAIVFLYRARITGLSDKIVPQPREIQEGKFTRTLPRQITPSLRYFWQQIHSQSEGGLPIRIS
ncbi:hypothetical protein DB345_14000 [Spartobacteria bacterium LR76]|nr:hypothetical protein DB345_14000 [Spartobacteria bacterium LR76]